MAFSSANLEQKLSQVTETQESIQNTSTWILFRKRYASDVAETWSKYIVSCPENLKLGLVYVANEVVQQAKIKGKPEFIDAWSRVLPQALSQVCSQVPSQVQDRITRVVKVWRDRKVFDADVIQNIEASTGSGPSFFSETKRPAVSIASTSTTPGELSKLVNTWNSLENFKMPETATSSKAVIESSLKTAQSQLSTLKTIQDQLKELKDIVVTRQKTLTDSVRSLEDSLITCNAETNEEPSPAIEPDSEPEIYTANKVQDDQSDDEQEVKRSKVDLDPKLMSFLANMN